MVTSLCSLWLFFWTTAVFYLYLFYLFIFLRQVSKKRHYSDPTSLFLIHFFLYLCLLFVTMNLCWWHNVFSFLYLVVVPRNVDMVAIQKFHSVFFFFPDCVHYRSCNAGNETQSSSVSLAYYKIKLYLIGILLSQFWILLATCIVFNGGTLVQRSAENFTLIGAL